MQVHQPTETDTPSQSSLPTDRKMIGDRGDFFLKRVQGEAGVNVTACYQCERCTNACPASVNVPAYLAYVRERRFDDALRVHLMRLGWVGEQGECWWEPVLERPGQLKCRGQVLPSPVFSPALY